jgi:two-component system, response regulator, stage 0 sporulation protein A
MKQQLKLLIVEDNPMLAGSVKGYFDKKEKVQVVGIAENGLVGEEMVKAYQPDVILLDVIMPQSDGFSLLEKISTMDLETIPQVIALSALGNENIIRQACELGARYYMIKPFNMDILYKRVLDLFSMRNIKINPGIAPVRSKSLDEKITTIFLTVGIPAHIKGYQFLREAIKLVVRKPDTINSITKQLYPGIAKIYDTSASKVERAIRHAIEVAWTRGKIENINGIFGYNIYTKNDKPTNGEFIALVSDKLIMEESA